VTLEIGMRELVKLKRSADKTAALRYHSLKWEEPRVSRGRGILQSASCAYCGAWVSLDTSPLPNSIKVGGTALGVNCIPHEDWADAPTDKLCGEDYKTSEKMAFREGRRISLAGACPHETQGFDIVGKIHLGEFIVEHIENTRRCSGWPYWRSMGWLSGAYELGYQIPKEFIVERGDKV